MKCIGHKDPLGIGRGFLLPIFNNLPDNMPYLQDVRENGTVSGFVVADTSGGALISENFDFSVELNDPELLSFLIDGELLAGDKNWLRNALLDRLKRLREFPCLFFEVINFCDYQDLIEEAFGAAYRKTKDSFGVSAADSWRASQVFAPAIERELWAKFDELEIEFDRTFKYSIVEANSENKQINIKIQIPDYFPKIKRIELSTSMNNILYQWIARTKVSIHLVELGGEEELRSKFFGKLPFSENDKLKAIYDLRKSGSFARTHKMIEVLDRFISFSELEIEELLSIFEENNQVNLISEDDDVESFYKKIRAMKNKTIQHNS